jgi:predicted GNAT superfamily acetyltransferase
MTNWLFGDHYQIHILETPEAMTAGEDLQRVVWPGNETDIVPAHMFLAAVHNGGLVIGAYDFSASADASAKDAILVGFVFGFPGIYATPDGPRLKHHSHMLGVHPEHRDQGIGFALKRAQWQMVRHQGIDRITWTYDPLLSRNAYLNITRLGAVCNTYLREEYGEMRDGLNIGLPSDRFQVDWWVNSPRVTRRLSKRPRRKLDLAHFLAAGTTILNPTHTQEDGLPHPHGGELADIAAPQETPLLLVEIPADFLALKDKQPALALEWRLHTRALFENLFGRGYLVTDFVHLPGTHSRSFYILSYGESLPEDMIGITRP